MNAKFRTYTLTFGHYTQKEPWSDVRSLTWADLGHELTHHAVGAKEDTCVVPAIFRGTRRLKSEAESIEVAFLDSDSGASLQEIREAVSFHNWTAIISSTHSHLTTRTTAKVSHWARFQATQGSRADLATKFLIQEKKYLSRVAASAHLVVEDDEYVAFEHQPCPKFRVAVPLHRPWRASEYPDQEQANGVWKERVGALAAAQTRMPTHRPAPMPRQSS